VQNGLVGTRTNMSPGRADKRSLRHSPKVEGIAGKTVRPDGRHVTTGPQVTKLDLTKKRGSASAKMIEILTSSVRRGGGLRWNQRVEGLIKRFQKLGRRAVRNESLPAKQKLGKRFELFRNFRAYNV